MRRSSRLLKKGCMPALKRSMEGLLAIANILCERLQNVFDLAQVRVIGLNDD